MPATSTFIPGTFCWPELCSGDAAAAKKFYGDLFGWACDEVHMPEGDYNMFKMDAGSIGGMYEMKPERKEAGVRPHWNVYVAVSNADDICKKVAANGGQVLMPPMDMGTSRMANLQDPTGAKICIWQQGKETDSVVLNDIGALSWNELYSTHKAKSSAFYEAVFGWKSHAWEGGTIPYTMFNLPDSQHPVGGMLEITPEMQGMPPQWLPYFQVNDTDATVKRVGELGGKAWCQPMDIPTVGRIAFFSDPQGAGFAVVKLIAAS